MCNFTQNIDLRCFVARQFLLQIYTLLSVKFSGLKKCKCKKYDKYEVCSIHFTPTSSVWEPFNPTKNVPEAAEPLSWRNIGLVKTLQECETVLTLQYQIIFLGFVFLYSCLFVSLSFVYLSIYLLTFCLFVFSS